MTKRKRISNTFREGSRKAKTFARFVASGEKTARQYGRKVGLKASTLTTWFSSWKQLV